MPIEKKYTLPELTAALKQFRRRVTLEYVLIGGRNDALDAADQLAQIASLITPAKISLKMVTVTT